MGLLISKCCCLDSGKDIEHFRPITSPRLLSPRADEVLSPRADEVTFPQIGVPYFSLADPSPILMPPAYAVPPPLSFFQPLCERNLGEEDLYWYEKNVILASKMAQRMDKEMD